MSEPIIKEKGHFRRNWIFYILILMVLGLAGFLWVSKSIALRTQSKVCEAEKTMLLDQAQEVVIANSEKHLELMMKTFVWAVRGEMTRGNQEQVDQYFKQLVKAEKVEEVMLVDKTGKIIISSNKKNEGNQLSTDYANNVLNTDEMMVVDKGDKQIAAAPVLSIDSRIGTLLVVSKTDSFQIETKLDLTKNTKE